MGCPHPRDSCIGAYTSCEIEAIIRRQESAGTSTFPLVRVTDALTHGLAYERSLTGTDPHNRICTGNVGELELVNTGFGILCFLSGRIIERRHVLCLADLLKLLIIILDARLGQFVLANLRGHRVL